MDTLGKVKKKSETYMWEVISQKSFISYGSWSQGPLIYTCSVFSVFCPKSPLNHHCSEFSESSVSAPLSHQWSVFSESFTKSLHIYIAQDTLCPVCELPHPLVLWFHCNPLVIDPLLTWHSFLCFSWYISLTWSYSVSFRSCGWVSFS